METNEIIAFPYSFFSKEGYGEIIKKLNEMGYHCVKVYPDEKFTVCG